MAGSQGFWGGEEITVSKLDAAARQLDTAIVLWFDGADIISIHTLAAASHQIIHDINKKRGGRDLIYDSLVIKDEYQKEWVNKLKSPMNFFKHADKDPDPEATIEVHSATANLYFFFSIQGLRQIGFTQSTIPQDAFISWTMLHQPNLVRAEYRLENRFPAEMLEGVRGVGKADFFQAFKNSWKKA